MTKSRKLVRSIGAAVALVVAIPAVAAAAHPFVDVPGAMFYSDAVDWAFDNGITTGTSPTTFSPDDDVTRGENITFAHRYDTNIVQPALSEIDSQLEALPTIHRVHVHADGTLLRGPQGATSVRQSAGTYELQFDFDVSICTTTGSVTNTPGGIILGQPSAPAGIVSFALDFDLGGVDKNGLHVETHDATGTNDDFAFEALITC